MPRSNPFDRPTRRDVLRWAGIGSVSALAAGLLPQALSGQAQAAAAASSFSPVRPPAVPLAVRSPYLTTWLPGDSLPGTWPTFWTGAVTAITGIARVDGTPFVFMGAPGGGWTVATQTNLATTAAAAQLQSQLGGGHPHTSNADTVGWLNRHWAAPTPADDYFAGPYHVSAATNRSGYDVMVDFEPHWFSDEDSTFPPRLLIYVPPSRRHTRPSAAPARRLTYGP